MLLYPTWNVQIQPRPTIHGQPGTTIRTVEVTAADAKEAARLAKIKFWPQRVLAVWLCSALGPA